MSPMRKRRYLYLPLVFLIAIICALLGSPSGEAKMNAESHRYASAPVPDLTGIWVGSWEDTKFFASDTLGFDITTTGPNLAGNGLAGMQPFLIPDEPGTMTGTIVTVDTLDFSFTTASVSGSGRIVGSTVMNGVGTVAGTLGFGGFTFTGTATAANLTFNFIFDSPSGGNGVIRLDNILPVDASTWGAIKSRYRDRR